jgi:hypothetical protein
MTWTITLEEDKETGDLVIPLPHDLLVAVGWNIGDTIQWTDNKDGTWNLSKKEEHSPYYYDTERNK